MALTWRLQCLLLALLAAGHAAHAELLLIKGGTVVNADRQWPADVLIRDGLIDAVGPGLQAPGARVLDATGKLVMPGGIDPHTHLDGPLSDTVTCDDFFVGQSAALAGGTTAHIDFALPEKHDLIAGLDRYHRVAEGSVMDYGFHMAVTSWSDQVAEDMEVLVASGVNSFKFFLAYKGELAVTDEQLLQGLSRCKELGALPMVHCESVEAQAMLRQRVFDSGVTGPEGHALAGAAILEDEGTARATKLAAFLNVPLYVVHVMSGNAAEEIGRARQAGQRVMGEATVAGIAADEAGMWSSDFTTAAAFVMSPPPRSPEHQRRLKGALAGGALSVLATDHAPFTSAQKAAGRHDFRLIPNGAGAIEERIHIGWDTLVNSGLITPSAFVALVSTNVAQIFNFYPQKGVLAPGSDADVIIFDPHKEHTISVATQHSATDTNIFEGRRVRGKVVTTISNGVVVWDGVRLNVTRGAGRFIAMPPRGPLFEGLAEQDASWVSSNFPHGPTPVRRAVTLEGSPGTDEL